MKLAFATHNKNKALEIQAKLGEGYTVETLIDLGVPDEIPETASTLEGNAQLKSNWLSEKLGIDCFADDTGLEITSLNNEPGVYSARYAGQGNDADANMAKVLEGMKNMEERSARFKTVISLNYNGENHLFVGIVSGQIRRKKVGANGFGYDPIFEPEGCGKTFAEMTLDEKNKFSHRSRAINKMMNFLQKQP